MILASNEEIGDPDGRAGKFTAISVVDSAVALTPDGAANNEETNTSSFITLLP